MQLIAGVVVLRALIVVIAVVGSLIGPIPWWLTALIVVRELCAGLVLGLRKWRHSVFPAPDSTALPAAIVLVVGLTLIAISSGDQSLATIGRTFGWPLVLWGALLSWAVTVSEARHLRRLLAPDPHLDAP